MCERILAQNCQKFDNFNFEFSMSHHNAHYQSYKNAPIAAQYDRFKIDTRIRRDAVKNYLADFFPLSTREGVPLHSAKLFWAQ